MKPLFQIIILAALSCAIAGQARSQKSVNSYSLPKGIKPSDYFSNVAVLQWKEQYRSQAENLSAIPPSLQTLFNTYGKLRFQKRFEQASKPVQRYDKHGRALADLSLIFEWEFYDGFSLEKVMNSALKTGYFTYVEPHFIDHLTYVPNDTALGSDGTWWYAVNKAFQAWDIQKGDTTITVGITDTGTELDHPDLAANIQYNFSDPIDGQDNDSDGYTDNFYGWDLGESDNNPNSNVISHGVHVCGLSSAVPDNITGFAGSGFNTRFLPIKITNAAGVLTKSYEAIVYAADHGCRIINCSWGSLYPSLTGLAVIQYATINKNALVVAGCGNNSTQTDFYPASFPYVLSIASHSNASQKSPFSNFSYQVDVVGPGQAVLSTWPVHSYLVSNGTSMASPVVAGCAALVAAQFPWMDALQIGQQLKATAYNLDTITGNEIYANRLGKGRLDMQMALQNNLAKSAELVLDSIYDFNDNSLLINDTVNLLVDLTNYLAPLSNAHLSLSISSSYVTLIQSEFSIGSLATYAHYQNSLPFQFRIEPGIPINQELVLDFTIEDQGWTNHVFIPIRVNVDYLNITVNEVWSTATSNSRIGYNNNGQGLGFELDGENLLYESSLMCGHDTLSVSDNVRSISGMVNTDFVLLDRITRSDSSVVGAAFDAVSHFADNACPSPQPVVIRQNSYAFSDEGHRRYVLFDYWIRNAGPTQLNNFYAGIFCDWDILDYSKNRVGEDPGRKLGYAYSSEQDGLYAGVKVLSWGGFNHYGIDNITLGNGGINAFDGYTEAEKYRSLSLSRPTAGTIGEGNDVIDVVSTGPYFIPPGDSVHVSFAMLAGNSLENLLASADSAQARYDSNDVLTKTKEPGFNCAEQCYVFPNPVTNYIEFNSCMEGKELYVGITAMDGKQKLKSYWTADPNQSFRLDVSDLPQGLYVLTLQNPYHSCQVKFVKYKE
ncbi:MAG: S8 family peptidase [Bacteroidia bacterium]|nr:S8 family peptidase [Bacteroidia bacterium]